MTLETTGTGYVFRSRISGRNVEARIERVKETPDRLKAEVAILVDNNPIARSNPVLTSVSGLDSFWRKLARRLPKSDWDIDWEAYTEELAARVIDAHRAGEPEIILGNVNIPTTVQWRIEPMLLDNQANVLFGPGGSGKSMIAIWLSVLMDSSHIDTGHDLQVRPGKVLYCDYETDHVEIASRVRGIHAGMGLDERKSGIIYRRCTQPLTAEADKIKDITSKYGVSMIVVDSLGLATGGGLDEAESVLGYFAALRWIGGTSLSITHTNKEGHIFGSVYTLNCGRSIWEIKKSGSEGDENVDVGLWHRKVNIVAKQKPRALGMKFSENSISITAKDPMEAEIVSESLSVSELVYQLISREGPIARNKMAEQVAAYRSETADRVSGAVATAITRHIQAKRIVEIDGELAIQTSFSDPDPTTSSANNKGEEEPWELI